MARETINYRERIVRDPDGAVGGLLVKGTHIRVDQVLASLANDPDLQAVFREYPEMTRDDVRAVLAYAHDRIVADSGQAASEPAISPQQFYAEITKRPDVSDLLRRLSR